MMAKVIKPFTTKLRRFKDGDSVSPNEDLTPHSFESLTGAGYIERLPVSSKPRKSDKD